MAENKIENKKQVKTEDKNNSPATKNAADKKSSLSSAKKSTNATTKKKTSTAAKGSNAKKASVKSSTSKLAASKTKTNKSTTKKATTKTDATIKKSPKTSAEDKKSNLKKDSSSSDKKEQSSKAKSEVKKNDKSKSSADKVLGIKKSKDESAQDKKDKIAKKQKKREEALKKSFAAKKSKKRKKKGGFFLFAWIKKLRQKRKLAKQAKLEAKRNAGPKRVPREVKIMRKRTFGVIFMCIAVSAVILGGFKLAGVLELNAGFAAKTGDKYFTEAEVTKYICEQTLYKTYSKSSSQWQQYLNQYGMNPESFRKQVIESKFKHEELVARCAEAEEVSVDPAEVDKHVQSFKNKYNNDTNYKKALETAGFTEDSYWDHVYETMLEKALIERDVHIDQPSDEDVKTYLSSYSSAYKDARKSSHILFNEKDKQTAQEVLDKLNAGSITWESAVQTYSIDDKTKGQDGNRGWDKIESFSMSYNDALSGLKSGELYNQLVTDKEGIHIVKCTEKWDTPEKIESLDGVPADIIADARQKKYESSQATELSTYLDKFAEENGLETVIYPMPPNVPYYFESKNSGNVINNSTTAPGSTTQVPVQ